MTKPWPAHFAWGTATASYQIEGAVNEDGRSRSIWDTFVGIPGAIANGETGDIADDHYHRMDEDVELMAELGVNAYRFSLSWSRILPDGVGKVNHRGLDFYKRLLEKLAQKNIDAYATIYHWDLPQVLQDRFGGWIGRDIIEPFVEYADTVSSALGDRVKAWTTLNEPWVIAWLGYGEGKHAPGFRDPRLALQVSHHLLVAHGLAVSAVRRNVEDATVGITVNLSPIEPASEAEQHLADAADANVNSWFLDPIYRGRYPALFLPGMSPEQIRILDGDMKTIAQPIDFIGVNYYTKFRLKAGSISLDPLADVDRPGGERTQMGWTLYPEGLFDVLKRVYDTYRPPAIFVTENGAAYADTIDSDGRIRDTKRIAYLQMHFEQLRRALEAGIPLKGYFVWSLMDNFEWAEGYRPRFGLIHVDYATQKRTIKDSGYWYRDAISRDVTA